MDEISERLDNMLSKKDDLPRKRQALRKRQDQALANCSEFMGKIAAGQVSQLRGSGKSLDLTRSDANQVKWLKLAAAYFRGYLFFAGARCGIDDLVKEESYTTALNVFQLVCAEIYELLDSRCHNLVRYSLSVYAAIDSSLVRSFKRRTLSIMDALNFPYTAEDDYNFVKKLVYESNKLPELRKVKQDSVLYTKIVTFAHNRLPIKAKGTESDWRLHLSFLVQMLIDCMELRFRFHFCTNTATNRIDKCQWYMDQLVSWYNGSLPFVCEIICDKEEDRQRYQVDFAAGIIRIASDKVNSDIRFILKNHDMSKVDLFSHLIDEFTSFLAVMKAKVPAEKYDWCYVVDSLNEEETFQLFLTVQSNRIYSFTKTLVAELDNSSSVLEPDVISTELSNDLVSVFISAFDRINVLTRPSCQIRWYQMFKGCLHNVIASLEQDASDIRYKVRTDRIDREEAVNRCFLVVTLIIALYDSIVLILQETPILIRLRYLTEKFIKYSAKAKLADEEMTTVYESFDMSKEATFITGDEPVSLSTIPLNTASSRLEALCSTVLAVLASATLVGMSDRTKDILLRLHTDEEFQSKHNNGTDEMLRLVKECYRDCSGILRVVRQKIGQLSSTMPLMLMFEEKLCSSLDSFLYKQIILDDGQQWSCSAANRFYRDIIEYWLDLVVQTGPDLPSNLALPRTATACRLLCMNPAGVKYLRECLDCATDEDQVEQAIAEFNLATMNREDILEVLALRSA